MSQWQNGLCNCCKDPCCCILQIIPGALCYTWSTSLVKQDPNKSCIVEALKAFICCSPCQRGSVREGYNIEGSFCGDCCTMCCCGACGVMQVYNEVNDRTP